MLRSTIKISAILIFCATVVSAQQQSSDGDCSPNISGVDGNVTITCDNGSSSRTGTFLFEEPLEGVYWNEWWAIPLKTPREIKKYGQAVATIKAEGKTVEFVGELSMNCENAKYGWRGVENFYTPIAARKEIDALVPPEVYRNFWKLLCRDNLG